MALLPVEVTETHVSLLVFVGDRAYKIKKPVKLPFCDLSSRAERARACQAEVELNRRLAPDAYLGVGWFTQPEGDREPVVVMRRLPRDRSLTARRTPERSERDRLRRSGRPHDGNLPQ